MSGQNLIVGALGEKAALTTLKNKGYKIIAVNYRNRFGEIDLVARDGETLVFIEVKTRLTDTCGLPQDSVVQSKQKKISRVAVGFLKENNLLDKKARFDVVSVTFDVHQEPLVDVIQDAFELDPRFTL